MEPPEISIIVPVLDEAGTVTRLLDDLEDLEPRPEIIFVDGGSIDGTPDIIASRLGQVLSSPTGRASQMNAGAAQAHGSVLWFLHGDTHLVRGSLDALLRAVADGHLWGRFNIRLSGEQRIFRVVETMMNLRSRLTGIATGDQGIFVTRAAFDAVGGFPDIPLMEDVALSRALRRLQRPACLRHPVLVTSSRRWETQGPVRTILLMWRLRLAYWLGVKPERLARQYR